MILINVSSKIIGENEAGGETTGPILVHRGSDVEHADRVDILDRQGNVLASLVYQPESSPKVVLKVVGRISVQAHKARPKAASQSTAPKKKGCCGDST